MATILKSNGQTPYALKYTSFYEQLPSEWQAYFNACIPSEKSEALKLLSAILKEYNFRKITEALPFHQNMVILPLNRLNKYSTNSLMEEEFVKK